MADALSITRREALAMSVAGVAGLAVAAALPAEAGVHDPMLDLIREYRRQIAYFDQSPTMSDDEMDALAAVTWEPAMDAILESGAPVTTMRGAIEALRLVFEDLDNFNDGQVAKPLVKAALAFLDQEAMA